MMSDRTPPSHGRPAGSATGLSDLGLSDSWNLAQLPMLARASLYLGIIMTFGGPSCLVTSSPEFVQPPLEKSAPFLGSLSPDPYRIIQPKKLSETSSSFAPGKIGFTVFSDDNGERVIAQVVLDYHGTNRNISVGHTFIPPGTYDSNVV